MSVPKHKGLELKGVKMGFSGGGSNILKAHRHDGTVVQDGGSLDFNNITQSNSAAGEIFYSDGVHLQQLAYPGVPAGETLTAAAASTSPSWAAGGGGGGGGWEFVEEFVLGSTTVFFPCTFASAIDLGDYAVRVEWWLKNTGISSNMEMEVNGSSSAYIDGGGPSGLTISNGVQIPADSWCIGSFEYYGNDQDSTRTMGFFKYSCGTVGSGQTFGVPNNQFNFTLNAATTSISSLRFYPTNFNQYINNYVRVYRMANS
jgi:hypothetical protein